MRPALFDGCSLFIVSFLFNKCHLPAQAVNDEGEVGEEIVADHAGGRDRIP